MPSLFRQAAWAVIAPFGLWCTFLALSTSTYMQRHFLYAHRIYPWWQDANSPQIWGFAKNQVTPFALTAADGETIYAWHVLPLPIYTQHERELIQEPSGFHKDVMSSTTFQILKRDPNAKLIIYFHGNAGHVPNHIRAPLFHAFTDATTYHLIAIDYRGFGKSTGFPTEDGLIQDASAVVDFAMHTAGIPPDRIVLIGQSLGSAVTTAVAERYAQDGVDFAGVILVSAFSSLPTMLVGYAIAGWVPVLRPLAMWPRLLHWVMGFVVDTWQSADRLESMVKAVKARGGQLRISMVHAANDWDIPCHEDDKLFASAVRGLVDGDVDDQHLAEMKDKRTVGKGENAFLASWSEGGVTVRQELYPYGGHNDIILYAPVAQAVMRSFGSETLADGMV